MIRFQKVNKIYPPNFSPLPKVALQDISFRVEKGDFVSIAGKSGAGKTTLLKAIFGEEKPTSGRVSFDGQDISLLREFELYKIRRKIGFIFQDYKLIDQKTAFENVSYALEVLGVSDKVIQKEVWQVLELMGLKDGADRFPHELSGGEKQRVAIARALIHRPDLILADEPTGNLDPYNGREIIRILLKINDLGTTILLATHSKNIINSLEKRVITLKEGRIVRDEKKGNFIL